MYFVLSEGPLSEGNVTSETDVRGWRQRLTSEREAWLSREMFLSDEGPSLQTLDFAFYIGSTPTFLYFDLYFNTAQAAHNV